MSKRKRINYTEEKSSDEMEDFSPSEDEWCPDHESSESSEAEESGAENVETDSAKARKISKSTKVKSTPTSSRRLSGKSKRSISTLRNQMFRKYRPNLPPKTPQSLSKDISKILESSQYQQKKSIGANRSSSQAIESDSDSSGDEYLVKPTELDLRSSFFDVKSAANSKEDSDCAPEFDCNAGMKLSGSEADDDDDEMEEVGEPSASTENVVADDDAEQKLKSKLIRNLNQQSAGQVNFHELIKYNEDMKENEEKLIRAQKPPLKTDDSLNVSKLLALGEGTSSGSSQMHRSQRTTKEDRGRVKRKKAAVEVGSDSDSDWEQVQDHSTSEHHVSIAENLQINIPLPQQPGPKRKNSQEVELMIKRRLNRNIKDFQIQLHKVSLICHISHGLYCNRILNDPQLMTAALKLLPNKTCYPDGATSIKYFESLAKWYKSAISIRKNQMNLGTKSRPRLPASLALQIKYKEALCKKDFVLIFVILLRAMGFPCRLVINLTPLPLKPPLSDLHSLSVKPKDEKASSRKRSTESRKSEQKASGSKTNESLRKVERTSSRDKEAKSKKTEREHSKSGSVEVKSKERKEASKKNTETSEARRESKETKSSSKETVSKRKESKDGKSRSKETKTEESTSQNYSNGEKAVPKAKSSASTRKTNKRSSSEKSDDEFVKPTKERSRKKLPPIEEEDVPRGPKLLKINILESKQYTNDVSKLTLSGKLNKATNPNPSEPRNEDNSKSAKTEIKSSADGPSNTQVESNITVTNSTKAAAIKKSEVEPSLSQKLKRGVAKKELKKLETNPLEEPSTSKGRQTTTKKSDKLFFQPPLKPMTRSRRKQAAENSEAIPQLDGADDLPRINLKKLKSKSSSISVANSDDDFVPSPPKRIRPSTSSGGKTSKSRQILSSSSEDDGKANKKKMDIWVEVYSEKEEKWVPINLFKTQVNNPEELRKSASTPVAYVFAFDSDNTLKDVSPRYCPLWNTATRKQRVDKDWLDEAIVNYLSPKTSRSKSEDVEFHMTHIEKPLPSSISEFKNHPLYALQRHLLKFEAIYPPNALILGFVRGEAVYSRDCVHTLHSREIWLKAARVVKLGEKPYKIVKARPKWDRLTNTVIKDMPLEIFGHWQTMEYEPPTAENGIVPRNAYGNVDLFKPTMLPKKTVLLHLPGLNKVCKKLKIDCAPAVVGFDFHQGACHPIIDGYVVCEEYGELVTDAWNREQEEAERKQDEKYYQRVYGNWKKLIRGLMIRERLKKKYNFQGLKADDDKPKKKKRHTTK